MIENESISCWRLQLFTLFWKYFLSQSSKTYLMFDLTISPCSSCEILSPPGINGCSYKYKYKAKSIPLSSNWWQGRLFCQYFWIKRWDDVFFPWLCLWLICSKWPIIFPSIKMLHMYHDILHRKEDIFYINLYFLILWLTLTKCIAAQPPFWCSLKMAVPLCTSAFTDFPSEGCCRVLSCTLQLLQKYHLLTRQLRSCV